MSDHDVDLLVIGGGSGGVRAARIAAGHGASVVLVEEHRLGGTCVIRGCVPKKLMVLASRFARDFADARGYGWDVGDTRFDWARLKLSVEAEVARLERIYASTLERAGVTVLQDRAVFQDAGTVILTRSGERLRARRILIATGATPTLARKLPGAEWISTSNELFAWPALPPRVLVQGAGYIALEFACLLRLLGSEVAVVMRADKILRGFDEEIRSHLQRALADTGIEFHPNSALCAIEKVAGTQALRVRLSDGSVLEVDAVLGAIGREPNTAGLGLEAVGVLLDARGGVVVDESSQTSVDEIYAVGDVVGGVALTPVAIRQGHAFADAVFGKGTATANYLTVPTAVFTTPEVGTVGLTEEAAVEQLPGDVDVYVSSFRAMKAVLAGRSDQMLMKLIVHRSTDRVIGAHIVGPEAAEMIQLLGVAMQAGATKSTLDATLAVHPTAAEELVTMRTATRRHQA